MDAGISASFPLRRRVAGPQMTAAAAREYRKFESLRRQDKAALADLRHQLAKTKLANGKLEEELEVASTVIVELEEEMEAAAYRLAHDAPSSVEAAVGVGLHTPRQQAVGDGSSLGSARSAASTAHTGSFYTAGGDLTGTPPCSWRRSLLLSPGEQTGSPSLSLISSIHSEDDPANADDSAGAIIKYLEAQLSAAQATISQIRGQHRWLWGHLCSEQRARAQEREAMEEAKALVKRQGHVFWAWRGWVLTARAREEAAVAAAAVEAAAAAVVQREAAAAVAEAAAAEAIRARKLQSKAASPPLNNQGTEQPISRVNNGLNRSGQTSAGQCSWCEHRIAAHHRLVAALQAAWRREVR
eukprot:COSAG05_NODE_368_length_10734_cov_4.853315_6_plen_356_part_00